jgi:hypothetical protein
MHEIFLIVFGPFGLNPDYPLLSGCCWLCLWNQRSHCHEGSAKQRQKPSKQLAVLKLLTLSEVHHYLTTGEAPNLTVLIREMKFESRRKISNTIFSGKRVSR